MQLCYNGNMDLFQSILLGLVQGITEFIPVSSSGHLELVRQIFNFTTDNFHLFIEFINLGTLLALIIYFRKKIWRIIKNVFTERNYKLALNIVITCIPAGVIGLLLSGLIEDNPFFSSLYTIAIAMGVVGLIMIIIDKLPHMSTLKSEENLTPVRALLIGLSQVFALIPGTSRSGTTIVAGRLVGLDSESAAEYSFLAAIPLMFGVCLKMFISDGQYLAENLGSLLISNLVAFIVGLLAIRFVLTYLKKPKSLQSFGKYRIIVSCLVIGVLLIVA